MGRFSRIFFSDFIVGKFAVVNSFYYALLPNYDYDFELSFA